MQKRRVDKAKGGPQFIKYFQPVIVALRNLGGSGTPDEVFERVAIDLKLTDKEQNELLPSGTDTRYRNQVSWARFYLAKEGLMDSSKRGVWSLTPRGQKISLTIEDSHALFRRVQALFSRVRQYKANQIDENVEDGVSTSSPGEETVASQIGYRAELLELLPTLPAEGFERLSQRILREAGFTQVEVTGGRSDGGIDGHGTLQINPLVSFKVLFQCKRYRDTVSPDKIRDFRGAMAGRADKGIFITTGSFTAEARREAYRDGAAPIELIDSEKLLDLLQHLQLGLKPVQTYEVDESFFNEFRVGS